MFKKILSLLCLLALLGCQLPALAQGDVQIVASFYPVYVIAANLLNGVEGAALVSLTPPTTGCLHDQALMPSDVKTLSGASVLLINGAGMESYLDDVLTQLPELTVVDASTGIELLVEEHDDHDDHDDHDHGEYNAHIWMSVKNAMQMTRNLADGLIAALPGQTDRIATNRDAYLARLTALDEKLLAELSPYQGTSIITFHEAFAYFAKEYGLAVEATLVTEPEEQLSAGEMARLCTLVKDLGLPPLFTEPAYPCPAAELIASETGAKVYSLDPATTGTLDTPAVLTAYEDALLKDLDTLIAAFRQK